MSDSNRRSDLTIQQKRPEIDDRYIAPHADIGETIEAAIASRNIPSLLVIAYHAVVGLGSIITIVQIIFDAVFLGGNDFLHNIIQLFAISSLMIIMLQVKVLRYENFSLLTANIYLIIMCIIVFMMIATVFMNFFFQYSNIFVDIISAGGEGGIMSLLFSNQLVSLGICYFVTAVLMIYWKFVTAEGITISSEAVDFYLAICGCMIGVTIVFGFLIAGRQGYQMVDAFLLLFVVLSTFGLVRAASR